MVSEGVSFAEQNRHYTHTAERCYHSPDAAENCNAGQHVKPVRVSTNLPIVQRFQPDEHRGSHPRGTRLVLSLSWLGTVPLRLAAPENGSSKA
jgi:hypothetical protein